MAALLVVTLAACGISKQEHQKAIEEARKETLAEFKPGLDKANADLDTSRSELAQARTDGAAAQARADKLATDLEAAGRRAGLAVALARVREAQLAVGAKNLAGAGTALSEAGARAKAAGAEAIAKAIDDAKPVVAKGDAKPLAAVAASLEKEINPAPEAAAAPAAETKPADAKK